MNNLEKIEILIGLLFYNIALYYFFEMKLYLVAIIVNSLIILLLAYISVSYSESVLDVLEEIKNDMNYKKNDDKQKEFNFVSRK